jgi:hypothetical protein
MSDIDYALIGLVVFTAIVKIIDLYQRNRSISKAEEPLL